jgi:steroid 5-alpha reductase family enzyme
MNAAWFSMMLWGTAAVAVMMLVLWLIHLPLRNAAIVDFGWALGLAMLGIGYAAFGGGWWFRSALIAVMSGVWGLRLALYLLFNRVIGHLEEGRYQELRRNWKTNLPFKFLIFFEFQALLDVVLSVPFLMAAIDSREGLNVFEWTGLVLWVIAIAGEVISDAQLANFKAQSTNRGRTCRVGLWNYSRHPNYFFEWLIWMSFAIFALGSPYGYWGLISPLLILYFLLRVTGIPATEEQALRSRGEEYREYQRTTSAFVPWFPKHTHPGSRHKRTATSH